SSELKNNDDFKLTSLNLKLHVWVSLVTPNIRHCMVVRFWKFLTRFIPSTNDRHGI
ncbi:hypothetical protein C0J52_22987, partial [Blattella germanica]